MNIYSLGNGMQRVDVAENHAKNNLAIGTVLHLNGYNNPNYVIVKNLGIDEKFSGYGANYLCIELEDFNQSRNQAFSLKYLSEKKDNRIQLYITDEIKTSDEVLSIWEKSEVKRIEKEKRAKKAEEETNHLIVKGKELFAKYIPENAKALIVAIQEIDDCDLMTDYFSTKYGEMVVLGYSTHKRDIFSEMRKHAHKIEETKHLATIPDVNSNGEKRTEENKSWWHPKDEHREKYSMGAGYYLKAANRYSTGWKIEKRLKWRNDWGSGLYISIAKRCVFKDSKLKKESFNNTESVTITLNEEKDGIEISFPGKPSEEIRSALKSQGFRWSRFQKIWYARQTEENIAFVKSLKV